jgi:hypothetical protein
LLHSRRALHLPYLPAFAAILIATSFACLGSMDPTDSAGVLVKEAYLYGWLAALGSVWASLAAPHQRRVLRAWLGACLGNGVLVLAQFADPGLLASMNAALAGRGGLDPFRPSGLFENSNAAALFQLSSFVPLLALQLRPIATGGLAAVLLSMMAGTGSMGALLALGVGIATLLALLVAFGRHRAATRLAATLAACGAVVAIGGAIALQASPTVQARVQYVLTGRSEYSAESRFGIWARGSAALAADLPWLGVGPDVWKRLDGHELHNDMLSFAVERGPAGLAALLMLAVAVVHRTRRVLLRSPPGDLAATLPIPAALAAFAVMSQTHEVFHQRPLWLVLALLETRWRPAGTAPAVPATQSPALPLPGSILRPLLRD